MTKRDDPERSNDHHHQIGNRRVKAMVHADGRVRLLDGTRGHKWVSEYSESGLVIDGVSVPHDARRLLFGMGFAQTIAAHAGVVATRTVFAPQGARGDDPVLFVDYSLVNQSGAPRTVEVAELWDATMRPIDLQLLYSVLPDEADASRHTFMEQFEQTVTFDGGALLVDTRPNSSVMRPRRAEAAPGDFYPGTLALALLGDAPDGYAFEKKPACGGCTPKRLETIGKTTARIGPPPYGLADPEGKTSAGPVAAVRPLEDDFDPGGPFALSLRKSVSVAPGETRRVVFAVAYDDDAKIGALVDGLRKSPPPALSDELAEIDRRVPRLDLEAPSAFDAALARELRWHGQYLLSSANFEEYYGVHNIDQGAAYGYVMGLRGAARDGFINAVAVTHLDPKLAREIIEYLLQTTTEDGKISYSTCNFGQLSDAVLHTKPSDLDLWLLWAVVEYVEATRDLAFLDESIHYHPVTAGKSATVRERIAQSYDRLTRVIGFGEHGLFKLGTGDWSDGIQFLATDTRVFHEKGESVFNTAFGAYVFPEAAELVEATDPALATKLRDTGAQLSTALEAQFNGKWLRRAWDGAGKPIGDDRVFLEQHAWALVGSTLTADQRSSIVKAIDENLSSKSQIGTVIVFPHVPNPTLLAGWDVNGGIWSAMNGLLAWGLSRTDPARAWKELADNSMARHADVYPDLWYGIWSGPDSYNASYALRPGEAPFHAGTPLTDFPVTNSNRHALPLIDLVKLAGIEYDANGVIIRPRLPFPRFSVRTPLVSLKIGADTVEGQVHFVTAGRVDTVLPAGVADTTAAKVEVNGAVVTTTPGTGSIAFDVPAGPATFRVSKR